MRHPRIVARVLEYLARAEWKEIDPWLRDDIRIAWKTVLHCSEGIEHSWELSFAEYLGKHPAKLIPYFVERARKHALMESGIGLSAQDLGGIPSCQGVSGDLHAEGISSFESGRGLLAASRPNAERTSLRSAQSYRVADERKGSVSNQSDPLAKLSGVIPEACQSEGVALSEAEGRVAPLRKKAA